MNYLKVLEATFVVHVVRSFSTNPQREITSAPKVYGFDTGFVCYHKGWHELRSQDMGYLWEHFVLTANVLKTIEEIIPDRKVQREVSVPVYSL